MSELITLTNENYEKIFNEIFNEELIIYEDIQGSKIWVNWDGEKFRIKPKSLSNKEINLVDLAMQNFYNPAIDFFNNLDSRVKSLLNKKWWFCFEYFPDNQPANVKYDKKPKNGLVLTYIKKGRKDQFNIDELEEYSRLIDVDVLPIIYKGKLTSKMKEAIKYFLNTNEKDLEYVFDEKSFAYFFYKILNPNKRNSFLMVDKFQDNLEKIMIKTSSNTISLQLLNPMYGKINDENSTNYVEIYTLILINFLNYLQSIDINEIKLKGENRDQVYIYLISKLFNFYIAEIGEDIKKFEIDVPEFFDQDKFKINTELIPNKLTKKYLEESNKLEYVFKVILGSFNKKKNKPIGIFTENTLKLFNKLVDDISIIIDNHLNKKHEIELQKQGLLDFSDYFNIKYDTDSQGQVYPDVYDKFKRGSGKTDTKKTKKKDSGSFYKK